MNQKLKRIAGRIFMAALVAMFVFAFAYTLPIDFALLAAIDMATYVDALVGVYVISRIARVRPTIEYLKLRAAFVARRFAKRAPRLPNSTTNKNEGANDDHPLVARAA